jgi:hypothetical protein
MKLFGHWQMASIIVFLFCLSGCRLVQWCECQCGQGRAVPKNERCAHRYIRSVRVYDKLTTLGIFDVLWLSQEIQEAAFALNSIKHDVSSRDCADQKNTIAHDVVTSISFYILAYQPKELGPIFEGQQAFWVPLLSADGRLYEPLEIREVDEPDFDIIYKTYLFNRLSKHKKIYSVRFAARRDDGAAIITEQTENIHLCIRSFKKQAVVGWRLTRECGMMRAVALDQYACDQSGVTECEACALCAQHKRCLCSKENV